MASDVSGTDHAGRLRCPALPRNAVPIEDMRRAEIPGMPTVRAWAGQLDPEFQADLIASVKQEPPGAFPLPVARSAP